MKKVLFLLAALMVVFSGCEKQGGSGGGGGGGSNPSKDKPLSYCAVNINDTTPLADILLACSNGSYMICDVNHDNKCGMLYFNRPSNLELETGYFIYVDSTGTPMMLRTSKGEYYFRNVTETSCDLAYQPFGGEPEYFWDVQLNENEDQNVAPFQIAASWGDVVTSPFTTWWSEVRSFDWTWDDHQRKAILPYMAKVTSFAITAVSAVGKGDAISVFTTLYDEALKSGLVDGSLTLFIDGYEAFSACKDVYDAFTKGVSPGDAKGLTLGYIASKLNDYADQALENSATFDEISWDIFNHPENHVALSRYMLSFPQSCGIALVKVTAQAGWYCDAYALPGWCSCAVDYNTNQLNFTISANEDTNPREATLLVYPPSGAQPARLTIKQDGYAFAISPTEITFVGKEAHNAILVQASDKVKSWQVKSCPNWLSYETSSMTVWLDTKPSMSSRGNQTGTVVIEATFHEGGTVEQTCAVSWYPDEGVEGSWDGTSWAFTGTVYFSDGSSGDPQFKLAVNSVASGSATVTILATQIASSISEDDSHVLHGSFSYQGLSGAYTVTRTGETTATCNLTLYVQGDGATGTGSGTLQGTLQ